MDARIAGQIRGIDRAVSRRDTTPAAVDPRSQAPAPAKRASGPSAPNPPASGTAPHEVFDANGDGVIESWSYAHGGDSYETFDPPPSGQIGANARPARGTQVDTAPPATHGSDTRAARASTAAAMQKAHGAYRRDGLAHTPAAAAAPSPAPAAAPPSSPSPPVTRPAAVAAVPSTRS